MKLLYLAAIANNVGMMSAGLFFGWASPSVPLLLQGDSPVPLTTEQIAWVVSLVTLGGTLGSLSCPFIVNNIGRKWTLLWAAVPALISWLMITFASTAVELYIARFLGGISLGITYIASMMYTGEIAPANIRGNLASTLTVTAKFGTFLEMAMGPFLSVRNLAIVSATIPVIFFLSFLWIPESPYHLMRKGRHEEAIHSLMLLRGKSDVSKEAEIIDQSVKIDLSNDSGLWELLSTPGNRNWLHQGYVGTLILTRVSERALTYTYAHLCGTVSMPIVFNRTAVQLKTIGVLTVPHRALIIVLVLITIQQWSGSLAVLSYAQMIFDAADNDFEGKYLTIILGGVQVLCTIVCASTVDRYGRRPLLIFSTLGSAVSTTMIGLYFYIQGDVENNKIGWLPGAGAILYIIAYCCGLAGLPFTITSEIFPTNVKALGTTLMMAFCNLWAFTVTSSYQSIAQTFGIYSAFWGFSVCSVLGVVFIYFYVPETKGKTLQEIQMELNKQDKKMQEF